MLHSNDDDTKCDKTITAITIIIIIIIIVIVIITTIIIMMMMMIVIMIIVTQAHDELGTCRTRLVSPKQCVLCIPACMLHGSLFHRL